MTAAFLVFRFLRNERQQAISIQATYAVLVVLVDGATPELADQNLEGQLQYRVRLIQVLSYIYHPQEPYQKSHKF